MLIALLLAEILSGQCGNVVTLIRFSLSSGNEDTNGYLIKSALKAKANSSHVPISGVKRSKEFLQGKRSETTACRPVGWYIPYVGRGSLDIDSSCLG